MIGWIRTPVAHWRFNVQVHHQFASAMRNGLYFPFTRLDISAKSVLTMRLLVGLYGTLQPLLDNSTSVCKGPQQGPGNR
jgi:hypothetical protein